MALRLWLRYGRLLAVATAFLAVLLAFVTAILAWGTKLSGDLQTADSTVDDTQRSSLYDTINKELMAEYLPAVPISSSSPALVLASNVQGVVASPLTDEKFAPAYKN